MQSKIINQNIQAKPSFLHYTFNTIHMMHSHNAQCDLRHEFPVLYFHYFTFSLNKHVCNNISTAFFIPACYCSVVIFKTSPNFHIGSIICCHGDGLTSNKQVKWLVWSVLTPLICQGLLYCAWVIEYYSYSYHQKIISKKTEQFSHSLSVAVFKLTNNSQ